MTQEPFSVKVSEIERHQVCYETVRGGLQWEKIYIVTPEDWNREHEGFIGFILEYDNYSFYFKGPFNFGFDGLLYINKIEEEKVKEIIGETAYKFHKARMEALSTLLIEWDWVKEEDGIYREDQACQGFSCGAAPLGCSDPRHCPKEEGF